MPLTNFGSILNFAEEIETEDNKFYMSAMQNPEWTTYHGIFEEFSQDAKKNIKNIQRIRRENVTEMILETIENFMRAPFCESYDGVEGMTSQEAIAVSRRLEERAHNYYRTAAEKIETLSEVARALKIIDKKHMEHLRKLDTI